jgi:phosphate transport system permease protein
VVRLGQVVARGRHRARDEYAADGDDCADRAHPVDSSKYLEAAAGLGLTQSQIVWSVLLPQSWSGLITGSLLALARAAGETAPIMFTATIFAGATMPHGIKESPVLSLPYHIFILAQDSFDPAVGSKLWGAALVLLALVFSLSLLALPGRLKIHEEANA